MMKRLLVLLALAVLVCAGIAVLCTSCASNTGESLYTSLPASEETSSTEEADLEPAAEPEPTEAPENLQDGSFLEDADLKGTVDSVEEGRFTLLPMTVTQVRKDAAVAAVAANGTTVEVDVSSASIQTVRIYNGGHDEPLQVDASALETGSTVYLYGRQDQDVFVAETVYVLHTGDQAS